MVLPGFGGQSAPPSLKAARHRYGRQSQASFRGAVRPPFIEGDIEGLRALAPRVRFGGQSAPPSLKEVDELLARRLRCGFRGAVRPPFIEGSAFGSDSRSSASVSGGSPPPLH